NSSPAPGGESGAAEGVDADLAAEAGGTNAAGDAATPASNFGLGIEEMLRRLDLKGATNEREPNSPTTREAAPQVTRDGVLALAAFWQAVAEGWMPEPGLSERIE